MQLTIKNLVHAIDQCNVPFTSYSLWENFFKENSNRSMGVMLRHIEKQGVIERVGKFNGANMFWRVDGRSAVEMHSEFRYKSEKSRGFKEKPKSNFPLGDTHMIPSKTRYFPNSWELRSCSPSSN
jgi:hypothetical protein